MLKPRAPYHRAVDALLLSVRVVLAAVFLVAAVGKLLDLEGSRRALEEFGVPARLARPGGAVLPVAELLVATALLIRPSARWGATVALLLLLAFVAGVVRAMSRGQAPDCHCFGQIHSEPAGRSTLIRNAVLAAGATLVLVAGPGPSLNGGLASLHGAEIALVAVSVLSAALAMAVAQLWGDRQRLQRELDDAIASKAPPGLPRGTPAPEFELPAVRGTAGSLGELTKPARPTVLVFLSSHCGPCLMMLPSLAQWQDSLTGSVTLAAIFAGDRDEIEQLSEEHELSLVLAQDGADTFERYGLRATPSAVLVSADGLIGGAPAEGPPAIEALIRTAVGANPAELVIERG
jgi:thiol-disulfide isomerase/thioredoxin/uncharacterized membrane protein YphA (DoxX/SURF4 family)